MSTRTYTLFPYTTLFRSLVFGQLPGLFAGALARELQQIGDLVQAEPHHLRTPDELKSVHVAFAVATHAAGRALRRMQQRSEEHTSELQSLMRISYAVFCLKKKTTKSLRQHMTTRNQ